MLIEPPRPADLHDREWEWTALSRFATDGQQGATLGVVSGRRRQGKTFLLQALCEATGGLLIEGVEATSVEALQLLGRRLAAFTGRPGRLAFDSWEEALDVLLALGDGDRPIPIVLDEFPYLTRAEPALPSLVQAALAPRREARRRSRTRLLLCGSALSVMGRLLAGQAPLRGRAGLELVVTAFPYREAATFWDLHDPALAVRVHAIVGGTPAYGREFVGGDRPVGADDFDDWVIRTVLNPALPLLREGRYLLADEPDLRETGLYHSVLAALAEGHETRSRIASRLGRVSGDLTHPLAVLEDAGFVRREDDVFRQRRPTYRIAEPFLRFHHAVVRPRWAQANRPGRAAAVWADAQRSFSATVLGPHFEQLARDWVEQHAGAETLGGQPSIVGSGVVNDPDLRRQHQVDVAALDGEPGRGRVLLVGEAKFGSVMDVVHLRRLQRIKQLLRARPDLDATETRLALISGAGFTPRLRAAVRGPEVVLVDLDRLYRGG